MSKYKNEIVYYGFLLLLLCVVGGIFILQKKREVLIKREYESLYKDVDEIKKITNNYTSDYIINLYKKNEEYKKRFSLNMEEAIKHIYNIAQENGLQVIYLKPTLESGLPNIEDKFPIAYNGIEFKVRCEDYRNLEKFIHDLENSPYLFLIINRCDVSKIEDFNVYLKVIVFTRV